MARANLFFRMYKTIHVYYSTYFRDSLSGSYKKQTGKALAVVEKEEYGGLGKNKIGIPWSS